MFLESVHYYRQGRTWVKNATGNMLSQGPSTPLPRAVEKGGKGVSYPGPRSVGGAPRSLRMIFLSAFTGNTKADNSKFLN